jgi:hypothetical protein
MENRQHPGGGLKVTWRSQWKQECSLWRTGIETLHQDVPENQVQGDDDSRTTCRAGLQNTLVYLSKGEVEPSMVCTPLLPALERLR